MTKNSVALCEGCGATTTLLEIDAPRWALQASEFQAFLLRHQACRVRLGDRPWITLEIVDAISGGGS